MADDQHKMETMGSYGDKKKAKKRLDEAFDYLKKPKAKGMGVGTMGTKKGK